MKTNNRSGSRSETTRARLAVALTMLALSWLAPGVGAATQDAPEDRGQEVRQQRDGQIKAKGAFTCDFALPGDFPFSQVASLIERDRMYMAERPGMQRKQIPMRIDFSNGNLLTGGRYLFDTEEDAAKYKSWVENDFILDGTHFFDRPYFLNPDCHSWGVVAASNIKDIQQQIIMRTERWSVPHASQMHALKQNWPTILREAQQRGLTGVWLLYNEQENLAELVYFADRIVPQDPYTPDFASLAALEFAAPLGAVFDGQTAWTKSFDRSQWVLTVWFPFTLGDHGQPSLWPNSPPLPEPYPGDGVCEVSRGENHANAPSDCGPLCGNGVCDAGEDTQSCPGDCRLP
jgi:hypothetical protein